MCPGQCRMKFTKDEAECFNPDCRARWEMRQRGWWIVRWPITRGGGDA